MTPAFDAATAARTLLDIRRGAPRPPGLPVTPPHTAAAYAVQRAVIAELGGGAWKMALLGGRDRHAGALPGGLIASSGDTSPPLPPDASIEVETALILGADLAPGADEAAVLAAIAEVRLCFEIVASRYADRTAVAPLEAMADAFSAGGIVLGDPLEDWREATSGPLGIRLWLDDQPVEAAETVQGPDDALSFLAWLASHAAQQGLPLRRGDLIITGARIGPLPLNGATRARATAFGAEVSASLHYKAE